MWLLVASNTCIFRFENHRFNVFNSLSCTEEIYAFDSNRLIFLYFKYACKKSVVASITKEGGLLIFITQFNPNTPSFVCLTCWTESDLYCWKESLSNPHLELELTVDSFAGVFTSLFTSSRHSAFLDYFLFSLLPHLSLPSFFPFFSASLPAFHSFIRSVIHCLIYSFTH